MSLEIVRLYGPGTGSPNDVGNLGPTNDRGVVIAALRVISGKMLKAKNEDGIKDDGEEVYSCCCYIVRCLRSRVSCNAGSQGVGARCQPTAVSPVDSFDTMTKATLSHGMATDKPSVDCWPHLVISHIRCARLILEIMMLAVVCQDWFRTADTAACLAEGCMQILL